MEESVKTFRYKFNKDVEEKMKEFAGLHVYDSKEQLISCFSEYWEKNIDEFMMEERRLMNIGYENDVRDAMYKSIKYYHIKRVRKENESVNRPERKRSNLKRRKLNPELVSKIDNNLKYELSCKKDEFKPSASFDLFMKSEEIHRIINEDYNEFKKENEEILEDKTEEEKNDLYIKRMKKLYKNRYFILTKK